MRGYNIVSGILLVLPIINFAVAAPALLPEKRQAGVDMAHIPEDAVTMLGKRVNPGEELDEPFLKKISGFSFLDDVLFEPEAKAPKPEPKRSNPGSSNPGPSNPGPSKPVVEPDSKRPKVRWIIGHQARS